MRVIASIQIDGRGRSHGYSFITPMDLDFAPLEFDSDIAQIFEQRKSDRQIALPDFAGRFERFESKQTQPVFVPKSMEVQLGVLKHDLGLLDSHSLYTTRAARGSDLPQMAFLEFPGDRFNRYFETAFDRHR